MEIPYGKSRTQKKKQDSKFNDSTLILSYYSGIGIFEAEEVSLRQCTEK
jgi:hypothetical protein